ncbi:MAG: aminotransferase class V-fold PLP-dependent enzyme [Frankiales bacterium]|nr:aminotransferase class V-fold PLP-dependent enzyme [Frankiales bacterium]
MTTISFGSDNHAGAHPEVLAAVVAANEGSAPAYGDDDLTQEAVALVRDHFGADADVSFVFNGTGANVVGLQTMLRSFENVICAESAHINVDECAAPERFIGSKLVDVPAPGGKLTPELVDAARWGVGDPHHVQAKVVSITQSTELGTVYSLEEIRALADYAHERGMYLHLDGARIANAAVALGVGLGDLGRGAGVDVLSFGATKNGALGAEAVVVLRPELVDAMPFVRKQAMQLASKMRFVSAQFVALLRDDLWRRNAEHANAMARRLADGVAGVAGVEVTDAVQANAVFAVLPPAAIAELQERFLFYVWNEARHQVRWMTSWSTTPDEVDAFVAAIRETAPRHA